MTACSAVGSNGDGFLTKEEVQEGMVQLGNGTSEAEIDEWMNTNVRDVWQLPRPLPRPAPGQLSHNTAARAYELTCSSWSRRPGSIDCPTFESLITAAAQRLREMDDHS